MKHTYFTGDYCYASALDIGSVRSSNQDALILEPTMDLFGVSDGMGGLLHGELASRFVRQALPLLLQDGTRNLSENLSAESAAALLREAVCCLSDRLFEEFNAGDAVMGATVCAVWLVENKALFVSLGDSRAYILRDGDMEPEQVTEDMNLAGLLYRQGVITKEEARHHPGSSRLTAFAGMQKPAAPQVFLREIRKGDDILLCSDGLYSMVEDRQLAEIMRSSPEPRTACSRMVRAANENGGRDNISAVLLRF